MKLVCSDILATKIILLLVLGTVTNISHCLLELEPQQTFISSTYLPSLPSQIHTVSTNTKHTSISYRSICKPHTYVLYQPLKQKVQLSPRPAWYSVSCISWNAVLLLSTSPLSAEEHFQQLPLFTRLPA